MTSQPATTKYAFRKVGVEAELSYALLPGGHKI